MQEYDREINSLSETQDYEIAKIIWHSVTLNGEKSKCLKRH